jgi:hypothetical protein
MTKQESPSDQVKLPGKELYDQSGFRDTSGTDDKIDKSSQNIELLAYFDALANMQHSEILCNLCADKEESKFKDNAIKSEHVAATQNQIAKAELYDNIMKERRKQNLRLKYGTSAIPSHSLASSLQITLSSCNERDLCETKIIIGKEEHGNDAITRKKTRDKVVKSLEPKNSAGNLSRLLTSTDIAEYDVTSEALSWQSTLKNIHKFCMQYDMIMMSLLLIPQDVDLSKPTVIVKARHFKNAIDDWQSLEDKDYFEWQEFLLHYGSHEETTSNNWLNNVLLLSIEMTLQAEVESDIISIPKEQRGSISTLRCIIRRMVMKNQEAKDALENYIRDFDITKFPGENVPTACLRLNAVA